MGKVIGLISIKGGVGKTTLSAALASDLANEYRKKVLLIDANYSAPNLGLHMDIVSPKKSVHDVLAGAKMSAAVHEKYGVDVVPGSYFFKRNINPLKLRDKLVSAKKNYDFVVLDSSPSLNEEVLSTMLASDELFVVTTPDYPTLSCSLKAAKLASQRGRNIAGIILNRISSPNYEIGLEEIQESTGIPVVARLQEDKRVRKSLFMRMPATLHSRKSNFSKEIKRFASVLSGEKERAGVVSKILGRDRRKERINREVLRQSFYKSVFED